jgi:LPXTG-motif cell wall-anchored protein
VLIRSRSTRFAALALAVSAPLTLATISTAFAAGDDADVTATFPAGQPNTVHVHSSKNLSRVTVVLCDGHVIVADKWDGTDGDITFDGTVEAVFIHSGNNTTEEAKSLLAQLAPGADHGESTGELAYPEKAEDVGKACEDPADGNNDEQNNDDQQNNDQQNNDQQNNDQQNNDQQNNDQQNSDTGNTGGENSNLSPEDISDPAPVISIASDPTLGTTVLGETFDNSDPSPAPAPAVAPTGVAGENVQAGGELPRTGSAHFQFLVTLGLSLLAAGVALQAAFRRNRSAAFPG